MKASSAEPYEVKRKWFVVDAEDKVLGRVAAEITRRLRGKYKSEYTPHVDTGDYIIAISADKLCVIGVKFEDKKYYRHSGFPGGIYERAFRGIREQLPGRVLEQAARGTLSRSPLGHVMIRRLRVCVGIECAHAA